MKDSKRKRDLKPSPINLSKQERMSKIKRTPAHLAYLAKLKCSKAKDKMLEAKRKRMSNEKINS